MSYADYSFGERLMHLRVQDEHRQAAVRRIQSEARKEHRGWVFEKCCRILCRVGSLFVSLGVRLLNARLPPSFPAVE